MTHVDFSIKSGSTAPALEVTLMDGDVPLSLTGATVTLTMRRKESGPLVIDDAPVTILDAANGTVSYQWQPGDTVDHGDFLVQWTVTFADMRVQHFPVDGFTTVTIFPDLEPDIHVLPDLPDNCWPVDDSLCADLHNYPTNIYERAVALAGQTLRLLTGGIVGGCPITIIPETPCRYPALHYGSFQPVYYSGQWLNTCPCGIASSRIALPGPVGRVDEVTVDSIPLLSTAYRVESSRWLVRTDGLTWPTTPDEGFTVTYLNAWPVDGLGAVIAGRLACEYALALTGSKDCSLPRGVREINRQGISMVLTTDLFPNGLTGIREVDAYVQSYNPHGLRSAPAIYVPNSNTRVLP